MRTKLDTELGIIMAIFIALGLSGMALMSVILFGEYLVDESVSAGFWEVPCLFMFAFFLFFAIFSVQNALFFIRTSESERARRASYFLILFPLVLLGFVVATTKTGWAPSLTFGFPLFIVGAVGFPLAARVLHKEARAHEARNMLSIRCVRCTHAFVMDRHIEQVLCPYCGQPNLNPSLAPWQCDLNRSGGCTAADLLRAIDLLNGGGDSYDEWLDRTIFPPDCPSAQ